MDRRELRELGLSLLQLILETVDLVEKPLTLISFEICDIGQKLLVLKRNYGYFLLGLSALWAVRPSRL